MSKEIELLQKVIKKGISHKDDCRFYAHHVCDCGAIDLYREICDELEKDKNTSDGEISKVLNAFLLEAVFDTQGIYPKSAQEGEKITYRTEWQEGWNEAQSNLVHDWSNAETIVSQWTKAQQNMIEEMLMDDAIHIYVRKDKLNLMLCMNDTFAYACSDCEMVPLECLEEVYDLWRAYDYDGSIAWASKNRDQLPIKPLQKPRFFEALAAAKGGK